MKKPTTLIALAMGLMLAACHPLREKNVTGKLDLNPKWGPELNLTDDETNRTVTMKSGAYRFEFPAQFNPFGNPKIVIYDSKNQRVATLKIPSEKIKPDGTFELYGGDSKSAMSFNILGGRRPVILSRQRSSTIKEYCTYTETYSCDSTCYDDKGNSYSCTSTCTRTVSGDRDAAYEKRRVKSLYRILFDGSDMMNAGAFTGESAEYEETVELAATSCS